MGTGTAGGDVPKSLFKITHLIPPPAPHSRLPRQQPRHRVLRPPPPSQAKNAADYYFLPTLSRTAVLPLSPIYVCPSSASAPPPSWGRSFTPECVVECSRAAAGLSQDVADQLEELLITVSRLGHGGQGAGGQAAGPLLLHQLVLALLRLRKLSGDDHQAQVNHEERANLKVRRQEKLVVQDDLDGDFPENSTIFCLFLFVSKT